MWRHYLEDTMQQEAVAELVTLRDFVRWGASRFNEAGLFFGHGTDNALDEALALVLHALHLDHSLPADYLDARLTEHERAAVADLLEQRYISRKPAAYLTGHATFAGLEFKVTEDVLVPRSPIAELIEAGFAPWLDPDQVGSVLDMCTGSGCIGIACAYAFPEARVDLSDISPAALAVARENIAVHGLDARVDAIQADVWDGLPAGRYDLIVSNPPYVDVEDMASLPDEYLHEPALGLAAGEDGLDIVTRMLAGAVDRLNPGGILVVEVGRSAGHLMDRYPGVPFLWLEFERGGGGVFLLTADQLDEHREVFLEESES
jgi:ribosomal protein L3 glutamine methyltransferase